MTYQNSFLHWTGPSLWLLFLKPGYTGLILIYSHLPGYHFISSDRENKAGGGVGLYIQSHLEFKLRTDLQSLNNALYESILVEIIQPRGKNISLLAVSTDPLMYWLLILTTLLRASYQPSALRINSLISLVILILIFLTHNLTNLLMSSSILCYLLIVCILWFLSLLA